MLVQTAMQQMAEGRIDDAARVWEQVLSVDPQHAQALFRLGQHRYFRKDPAGARQLLERAERADPKNPNVSLSLAFAFRAMNEAEKEMGALVRALTADPYFLPALLAKGMLEERLGYPRVAAQTYKMAVSHAPPDEHLSGELRSAVEHARDAVSANAADLEKHLKARLDPLRAELGGEEVGRFEECKDIAVGAAKIYTQEPSLLYIPRLPPIGYYDRSHFPWLATLEAATADIRREAIAVLEEGGDDFQPYVAHPDGVPINQWAELNHSPRWSTYFLWKDGERLERQSAKCPVTAAISETLPVIDIPRFGPTVMYSVLAPHTRIPQHSSVTNARLVVHLPLIVPDGCYFRVGNETRPWREGQAWVFDDTINHEAWNDSDQYRVILMIDIWNPFLSLTERKLVGELLNGMRDYYGGPATDKITGLPLEAPKIL